MEQIKSIILQGVFLSSCYPSKKDICWCSGINGLYIILFSVTLSPATCLYSVYSSVSRSCLDILMNHLIFIRGRHGQRSDVQMRRDINSTASLIPSSSLAVTTPCLSLLASPTAITILPWIVINHSNTLTNCILYYIETYRHVTRCLGGSPRMLPGNLLSFSAIDLFCLSIQFCNEKEKI